MKYNAILNSPWTLEFERDGTEDLAVIRGSDGSIIATSSEFWLPEDHDPTPATLAAMQLMVRAPELLIAAETALRAMVLIEETNGHDCQANRSTKCPLHQLDAVIKNIASQFG